MGGSSRDAGVQGTLIGRFLLGGVVSKSVSSEVGETESCLVCQSQLETITDRHTLHISLVILSVQPLLCGRYNAIRRR